MNDTGSCSQLSSHIGQNIGGCYYDSGYTIWPYYSQPPIYNYYPVQIDYDFLAEKIVEKLRGEKKKSVEDVRRELNKLLDELKDKK